MDDLFPNAGQREALLHMIRPPDVVRVRPGRTVSLQTPNEKGRMLTVQNAQPGEAFGLLRTVGYRWVIFPLKFYGVSAARVESPELYRQDPDVLMGKSRAVIFFPCGFGDLEKEEPHIRPLPLMIGEVAMSPQSVLPIWPPNAPQQLPTGTPVIALRTLSAKALKRADITPRQLGFLDNPQRILFLALGDTFVVRPDDFEYLPPTVGGTPYAPRPQLGRRVDLVPTGASWTAHDVHGPLINADSAVSALDHVDELTIGRPCDVWLDMGEKRRRVRTAPQGPQLPLTYDWGMSPRELRMLL